MMNTVILSVYMLNTIILSDIMLNVIKLSVIVLSVVAPYCLRWKELKPATDQEASERDDPDVEHQRDGGRPLHEVYPVLG